MVLEPVIEIVDLVKVYQTQVGAPPLRALDGINFSVKKGEVFGLIGMSGAGKSTLIRCLTCLERPTEGRVFIAGNDLVVLDDAELRQARKKMGMIFQHFNLFSSRTALQNVTYPLEIEKMKPEERKKRALELLALVGLKGKEKLYPSQLSGGEKQRVAIARALATHPDVLLSDEATSALDPRTTDAILELLAKLNRELGLTILMITHEMEVIKKICTHVAVLEHGKIIESGPVAEVFVSPKHLTTRQFLLNLVHDIPKHFFPSKKNSQLLRLTFRQEEARRPIISQLVKTHGVDVNILLGGIDRLRTETIGHLIIELAGSMEERMQARLFLEKHGVHCEEVTGEISS